MRVIASLVATNLRSPMLTVKPAASPLLIQPVPTSRPGRTPAGPNPTVSAIVPARNEAPCIAAVVRGLLALRSAHGEPLIHEVVVADNGSSDDTARIAREAGARVVDAPLRGYGQACWQAVCVSTGEVLLFVDGDGAADPDDAGELLDELARGADLVIGDRHQPDAGAMTAAQHFGNGLACLLMRIIWRIPVTDLGPYRAIWRDAFDALDMRDRGFGWTVEMQVRAHLSGLRVSQIPVKWHARAGGESKISGTLSGVASAGVGILGMVACLWWRERRGPALTAAAAFPTPAQSSSNDLR